MLPSQFFSRPPSFFPSVLWLFPYFSPMAKFPFSRCSNVFSREFHAWVRNLIKQKNPFPDIERSFFSPLACDANCAFRDFLSPPLPSIACWNFFPSYFFWNNRDFIYFFFVQFINTLLQPLILNWALKCSFCNV